MNEELELLRDKKGFICDMDGVIYHGNRLLPGVTEFVYEPTSGKSHQTCLRPDRSKGGCLDRRVRRSLAGRGA